MDKRQCAKYHFGNRIYHIRKNHTWKIPIWIIQTWRNHTRIDKFQFVEQSRAYGYCSFLRLRKSPCGACREYMMQLDKDSGEIEILLDLESKKTVRLKELIPDWWGADRFS